MSSHPLSPRQKAYVRKKTTVHELDPSEASGELNIVPFLDIVTNIIMFLLATTAAVLTTVELEAHLPTLSRGRAHGAVDTGSTLNLSVTVAEQGVIVAASGGVLTPGCTGTARGAIAVPRSADRSYDWTALTRCLATIHGTYPDERQGILTADPTIEFADIIHAMDAMRSDGTNDLFPEIMLSAGVR